MRKWFKKILLKLTGKKYVVNLRSKEIHMSDSKHRNCHLNVIVNKKYINEPDEYIKNGYNGCRWCYKEKDNG